MAAPASGMRHDFREQIHCKLGVRMYGSRKYGAFCLKRAFVGALFINTGSGNAILIITTFINESFVCIAFVGTVY